MIEVASCSKNTFCQPCLMSNECIQSFEVPTQFSNPIEPHEQRSIDRSRLPYLSTAVTIHKSPHSKKACSAHPQTHNRQPCRSKRRRTQENGEGELSTFHNREEYSQQSGAPDIDDFIMPWNVSAVTSAFTSTSKSIPARMLFLPFRRAASSGVKRSS